MEQLKRNESDSAQCPSERSEMIWATEKSGFVGWSVGMSVCLPAGWLVGPSVVRFIPQSTESTEARNANCTKTFNSEFGLLGLDFSTSCVVLNQTIVQFLIRRSVIIIPPHGGCRRGEARRRTVRSDCEGKSKLCVS